MARTKLATTLLLVLLCGVSTQVFVQAGCYEEGLKYLGENKRKKGVIEMPSGMQYRILDQGTGRYHPLPSTRCKIRYTGTLIDGTEFDSSDGRGSPTTFSPNDTIKGWKEAMLMMVEGDKFELYIPAELAYGYIPSEQTFPPKIPPDSSVLIFTLEIVEILGNTDGLPKAVKCVAATGEKCDKRETQYIETAGQWTDEKKATELARLNNMTLEKKIMERDHDNWILRRSNILEQLVAQETGDNKRDEL